MKVPEDLIDVLKRVNQNIQLKLELGASLDDLTKDEVPLIKYAEKGLKISGDINLISNIKDSILEVLKMAGEENEDKTSVLKMIAPLFMMQL